MTSCMSQSIYVASIVFFTVGAVLFLTTALCWLRLVCKRRVKMLKARNRPLPLAPPSMTLEIDASGAYIDLQESVNKYETVNATPGVKQMAMIQYIPRDAMHETFDGSRMPVTMAPQPPSHPPVVIGQENENETSDSISDTEQTDETDENQSGVKDFGTKDLEEDNENGELECTYESTNVVKPNRDRLPTIPVRRPFKK